ncbi:MAG: FAD-dependent oxidoreductase [Planctomycetes bacterium]|nr:FAD-dependent oxidoreductase [Planctomycetota bacterium]MCH9776279.1 FAD-dependent oxidoreductase [Planctomycetota bacterium]MCH9789720.1 FAD-dependent oxidoreductase [Planctomycetota bacterium]MDF1744343.1 FAD-dependent oxidoreductase [Gimesia sp.]
MKRRHFLEQCGIFGSGIFCPTFLQALQSRKCYASQTRELKADVVIIGGGLGGCASALAACRNGARVILTEPTDWIGGQISQQAVPPDEHKWIETFGRTKSYAQLRSLIRNYYKQHYPLTSKAQSVPNLNPGNGSVSRICHEPKVGIAALQSMLAPEISRGQLTLLLNTRPVSACVNGDHVETVTCHTHGSGHSLTLHGSYFIDASEEGDLLPLTGTEYALGAESQSETNEPHAPEKANPANIQSFTHCFAVDHLEGEDHTIERPAMYEFWKNHVPPLTPAWSGKILSLYYSYPRTLKPKELSFVPCGKETPPPKTKSLNLWLYRRMIDRNNFVPGTYASDITVINWPQNDYMLGNITDVAPEERKQHLHAAKQLSLSLLYWLQTEAPRPDGKQGWQGLRLRKDIVGTEDGLAKYPYIRESRRILAELTIKEQDLSYTERLKEMGKDHKPLLARPFEDSVGIGYYHLDLHPSSGGDNYIDTGSVPFQIPLGAMIPQRIENLIPGCKNIGTTHLSNGCYRLHPVEWSIGEAAGALCAHAISKQSTPRQIRNNEKQLKDFQTVLTRQGIELEWSKLR